MKERPSLRLALTLLWLMAVASAPPPTRAAGVQKDKATYGITVLNVDADSGAPLVGWTMRLHAGSGCTGAALQTDVTDAAGLASFADLEAGVYSVQEALRPGYVNVSPLCQDITLTQSPLVSTPGSRAGGYPPGGDDAYGGGAYLALQLGTHPIDRVTLNGALVIRRHDPGDANRNGLADVQMQVVSMTLRGNSSIYGPLTLRRRATAGAAGQRTDLSLVPQALPWTSRAAYLIVDNGVVAERGSVFSFGGHNDVSCVTDMRRWDPSGVLGAWSDLAPLPEVLDAPRGVLVDGNIYVPGGWDCAGDPQAVLYIYNIGAGTWSTAAASPPSGRAAYGIAAVGGQVYRIGGCTDAACTPSADVDVYDIDSDTWSTAAAYPIEIAWQACGTIEGQIYCAGGYDGVGPTHKAYRYTPLPINTWVDPAMRDLCHQWWAMGAGDNAVDAGGLKSLYLYGGVVDGFDTVTDLAVHYDKSTNSWYFFQPLNMAVFRHGGGSANSPLGNQYAVGGLLSGNLPGVGFTLDAPAADYPFQHYPTIPSVMSLCAGPPPVIGLDGLLEQLRPGIPFPSSGRFNLFFDLDVGGVSRSSPHLSVFHNTSPLQVRGAVAALPMDREVFVYGSGSPGMAALPLFYDSGGQVVGYVRHFGLVTMSPGDTLVTFANRQASGAWHFVYLPLIVKSGQSTGVR